MKTKKPPNFLDFYKKHRISPVSQDISSLERHFERRTALYRHLGVPPGLLQGKSILEFGPGSGHNAIFTNSLGPSRYVLVDANPAGLEHTRAFLDKHSGANRNYEVVESLIEDYRSIEQFDLVLCEGTIPGQHRPDRMLRTVGRFVAPGGILIITCIDGVSWLSETLRRLAGSLLTGPGMSIGEKIAILKPFFEPHLRSLKGMSRPAEDWILDNIVQPFLGRLLSMKEAIAALENGFFVYGSSPHFFTDWRWYKDITGDRRGYNRIAAERYDAYLHNLLDYRYEFGPRPAGENRAILKLCSRIFKLENSLERRRSPRQLERLQEALADLAGRVGEFSPRTAAAIGEFEASLRGFLKTGRFDGLKRFAAFFGRGQQYLSFIRKDSGRTDRSV